MNSNAKKILVSLEINKWRWVLFAFGITILVIILIGVPKCQVASLRQDVNTIRKQNPKATLEIINAEKAALDAETAARVALVQGIGLILITGGFSVLNYSFTRDKQIEERFDKALEKLQSENISVRVSSINRLEQHTRDKEQDIRQVLHILAAYIRDKAALPFPATQENPVEAPPLPADIQEAMNVISSLKCAHNSTEYKIDLSRTDLRKLVLPPKANLRGIDFQDASLQGVELLEVDLRETVLTRTNFRSANLDQADFRDAKFFLTKFEGASVEGADFQEVNTAASRFERAKLKGANFQEANCQQTHFDQADLEGANFQGANLTWTWFKETKGVDLEKISRQAKSSEYMVGIDGEIFKPESTP